MKILIVEDDAILGMALYRALSGNGFDVKLASTGKYAKNILYQKHDLIILDLGLPDIDGIDLLKNIRKNSIVPILIISARSHIDDRIKGLENGADDYMVKPFELGELLAKVKALIRRIQNFKTDIIIGKITFNICENKIKVDNQIFDLPLREYKILEFLLIKRGSIVTKENIANYLCSSCGELSDNAIEVYIHRLRKRFDLLDVKIKTIHGIGYSIQ
jgi:two-component system OmpR family response regulator